MLHALSLAWNQVSGGPYVKIFLAFFFFFIYSSTRDHISIAINLLYTQKW